MSERYKLCEGCGSEFQLRLEACLDCGGPLVEVDPRMGPPPRRREPPPPPPPEAIEPTAPAGSAFTPADRPFPLRVAEPAHIEALAERMDDAGIRSQVAPEGDCRAGCKIRWALWVAEADRDAAAAVDRRHLASLVPDGDSFVDLDGDGCPACGAARAPGAVECAECGLTLDFAPDELDEVSQDEDPQEKVAL